ncbi:MAG: hypothetical protein HC906_03825 [Bacteroidales bacterium]|nr:hypothetical protein [Bacteroidales bacterium]
MDHTSTICEKVMLFDEFIADYDFNKRLFIEDEDAPVLFRRKVSKGNKTKNHII